MRRYSVGLLVLSLALGSSVVGAIAAEGNPCIELPPDEAFVQAVLTSPGGAVERRVALVVGNAAYQEITTLANAVNDAEAMAPKLQRLGFTVFLATDAAESTLRACADATAEKVRGADIGLFYYSGHGIQIDDENFLVAVDAPADLVDRKGLISVYDIAGPLYDGAKASLVFLDACRDNPFASFEAAAGLAVDDARQIRVDAADADAAAGENVVQPRGVFVAYATSPNAVAFDGDGNHSPFTAALLKHIDTPGMPLQQTMSVVGNDVGEATNWLQTPWSRSSLNLPLKLAGGITIEEAQAISRDRAREAIELLNLGKRAEALSAALRGFSPAPSIAEMATFPEATEALKSVLRSRSVVLPIDAEDDGFLSTISADATRALTNVHNGENVLRFWALGDRAELIAEVPAENMVRLGFTPDGTVAFAGGSQELVALDGASGAELYRLRDDDDVVPLSVFSSDDSSRLAIVRGNPDRVDVVESGTGALLASATIEQMFGSLCDGGTGLMALNFVGGSYDLATVMNCFSNDVWTSFVVVLSPDFSRVIESNRIEIDGIHPFALRATNERVLVYDANSGSWILFARSSGEVLTALQRVLFVNFSPDGMRLAGYAGQSVGGGTVFFDAANGSPVLAPPDGGYGGATWAHSADERAGVGSYFDNVDFEWHVWRDIPLDEELFAAAFSELTTGQRDAAKSRALRFWGG